MVNLVVLPTPGFPKFESGSVQIIYRYQRLLLMAGDSFPRLTLGSAGVMQKPVLRIATLSPFLSYSANKVEPSNLIRPFNLYRGRIEARAKTSRRLVVTRAGRDAFQRLNGSVVLRRISAAFGTLSEFGYWPTTASDPAVTYFTGITTTSDTGGPGSAWKQVGAIAVPPKDAKYMAVGVDFSVASGDLTTMRPQYLKYAQVEKVGVGAGTGPYSAPREVRTSVQPDRLNWDTNPAFAVNATDWTSLTRTANTSSPSGYAGVCAISATAGAAASWTHSIPILYPDAEYMLSFLVWADRAVDFTYSLTNSTILEARVPSQITAIPTRVWIRFKTDATASVPVLTGNFISRGVAVNGYVTAALVEKDGRLDAEYFDGSTYGSDSIWENGATAGQTRSYYYKNRLERLAALKRLLKANVPFGVSVAEPRLGVLPADIAPVGTSNIIYGTGVYGGGIFGGG